MVSFMGFVRLFPLKSLTYLKYIYTEKIQLPTQDRDDAHSLFLQELT